MRSFSAAVAQERFDELIESLEEKGPFTVLSDDGSSVVFVSSGLYEALLNSVERSARPIMDVPRPED